MNPGMITDDSIRLMGRDDPPTPPMPNGEANRDATASTATASTAKAKRAWVSCTNCRQSKVKCNAGEVFPAPCANCRKHHKECRTDVTFKRTPVKGRLEEVTKELDRIKRARSSQEDGSLSPNSPLTDPQSSNSLARPGGSLAQYDTRNPFGLDELDNASSGVSFQSLEGYHFNALQITELFRYFVRYYMPHLPILDTRMKIDTLHQNNHLLFWTIILISSHHPDNLVEPYRTLLARHLLQPVRSIQTIHALLLFCLWPIPVRKQLLDSSWNYCGFALSAAIRMGLHQSDATWEYDFSQFSAQDMEIRRRTWLGCYTVSTFLSSDLGLPNLIRPAMDLNEFSRPGHTPDPLTIQFEIERNVARFSATMSQRGGSLVKSSLILMFDRELKILAEQVLATGSPHLEINFLGARLSLYAFSILGETTASMINHHVDLQVKQIWYLGFETAVRLAHLLSSLTNNTPLETPHRAFPKHMFWILLSSGFYLLKFLAVSAQVPPAESELARNGIRLVYSTLQTWSTHSLDESARIARIISLLANAELQGTLSGFTRVNKRPPLSIVADVMEMVGWLRARQREKEAPAEDNTQVAMNNNNPMDAGGMMSLDPALMLDPMMLDDSIWENLDAWLTQEVELGNLLHPYPEGDFGFSATG